MSAILSADDLNDFISPGVACIKPIETLPKAPESAANAYEVTTEDKVAPTNPPPAQISLTDCLACSGCVTSAEAVLVSLQSQEEVLRTLDRHEELPSPGAKQNGVTGVVDGGSKGGDGLGGGKIFVASVSPQVRASIAATYRVTEREAGNMIEQLLCGEKGLRAGGERGNGFTWVMDTNTVREAALLLAAEEVNRTLKSMPQDTAAGSALQRPILTSACPGWVCYAEKTHPYVLPHMSRLKSPQALTGTLLKSVLSRKYGLHPSQIWHLAVMPCFDKKLEASRSELMSGAWLPTSSPTFEAVRDVDCVITARELVLLAQTRALDFASLPTHPVQSTPPFPDPTLETFLFPSRSSSSRKRKRTQAAQNAAAGTSGGYLYHIMQSQQALHPGSKLDITRGKNADVVEYTLIDPTTRVTLFKAARFYGFRNIQNLVRRVKPARKSRMPGAQNRILSSRPAGRTVPSGVKTGGAGESDYAYVEVMACPGGCTNGGGQIKAAEVTELRGGDSVHEGKIGPQAQKEWLGVVDEAYFSADSEEEEERGPIGDDARDVDRPEVDMNNGEEQPDVFNGIDQAHIRSILRHWVEVTGVNLDKLVYTSYRKVESDVGKHKITDEQRVAGLASTLGGGW